MAISSSSVAEMQGLYGPFTISERVIQKIWLRGDFSRRNLRLTDGRTLEIRSLGAWNLLGGPDFRGARLVIDGRDSVSDVEIHFRAQDWAAHGHADDHAYDKVGLHVVLFPMGEWERAATHRDGRALPTLVLLPLLNRDLDEYASDDALEGITERDEWERFAELAALAPEALRQSLVEKAEARWRQKVHFAKLRVDKLGFADAAHHTALEILGYRHNRAPMLSIATQYPLVEWRRGEFDRDAVFTGSRSLWRMQGVRPANHPRTRLQQYHEWCLACSDWPQQLLRGSDAVRTGGRFDPTVSGARAALGLRELRANWRENVVRGAISGTRFDNLVCDGFLPLVAAERPDVDRFAVWFHWFLGDVPAQVRRALPKLGVTDRGGHPICHGWAQGLLGWMLERQARASV
jgi:hypothetical protein